MFDRISPKASDAKLLQHAKFAATAAMQRHIVQLGCLARAVTAVTRIPLNQTFSTSSCVVNIMGDVNQYPSVLFCWGTD